MSVLSWFVAATTPLVQRLARAYGIRVDQPFWARGEWPLVIEDPIDVAKRNIPPTAIFNTRCGSITVGSGTIFGDDVMLLTGKHLNTLEAAEQARPLHSVPDSGRDITVGRNCYVGSRAIIIGPAKVGDHAVIGAGSVVTRDVPAYAFVAGVPARLVKSLAAGAGREESS